MSVAPGPAPVGARPRAVPYDARFLELSWTWLTDPEIRRLTMTPAFTRAAQRRWFAGLEHRPHYLLWGVELGDEPIGAFGLKEVSASSAEYWGYIGEKRHWGRGVGRWMVAEALQQARARGIDRVRLRVARDNRRAIRLYERCGFVVIDGTPSVLDMERALEAELDG